MKKIMLMLVICPLYSCGLAETEGAKNEIPSNVNEFDSLVIFTLDDVKISIRIPAGWERDTLEIDAVAFRQDCNDTVKFCPNLVVTSVPRENNIDLDSVAKLFASSLSQKYAESKIVRIAGFFKILDSFNVVPR